MASLATAEPALCPGALPAAESIVPACMFAPDRGCVDDPCGEEGSEDGEGTNGETADHLDLSSKVGLTVNSTQKRLVSKMFQPSSGLFWLSEMNDVRWLYTIPVACELDTAHFVQTVQNSRKWHVYCSACVSGQLAGYPAVHLLQEQSGSLDCQNTVTVIEWFAEQVAMKWNKNNNMICQYLCGCLNHTTSTRPVWLCLLLFDKTFTPISLSHFTAGPRESNRGTVRFITTAPKGADRWRLWRDDLCGRDGFRWGRLVVVHPVVKSSPAYENSINVYSPPRWRWKVAVGFVFNGIFPEQKGIVLKCKNNS